MSPSAATPLRILHVEDVPADAELAERELLRAGIALETRRVETREAFLAALSDFAPDLILSDYRLPAFDGMQALLLAKEHSPDVPFIITTGRVNEETAVACMRAGAEDYVLKDHLSRLGTAVRSALEKQRLLAERKRAEGRIRQLNRLLKTISEVNQLIVRTDERQTLLSGACRILVEHGGFRMAWVGLADREKGLVLPAARAGDAAHYLDQITVRFDETPEGRGPVGAAIRTERHVVVVDLAAEPTVAPWRERMLAHGFRTVGVFPFRMRGEVAGTLTVYLPEPGAIGDEETTLLDELAADLGYALEAMEDRTERRKAEEALRDSEERFRLAAETSVDVIYEWDIGTRIQWFGNVDELMGYAPGEFPRTLEGWAQLLHPEDREPVMAAVDRQLKGEAPYDIEYRVRKKDRAWGHWWVRGTVIRDAAGKPHRWIGSVTDITERKQAEADLARSELYYRSLIENSLDITAVLSPEGDFRYVSSSVERVLGYRPEELGGMNAFGLVHSEDLALVQSKIQRVLEASTRFETVEARFRHRDGSWRVLSVIGKLLPPEIGERGLIVSARDLTDRQQLEAQLLQAQKMEAVGRLAGGVAHDFNNLLTVIQGYGEMLSTSLGGDETRREQVTEILKAAERAAALTHQLLAFSRRQALEMRVLDLGAAVGETEKMLRRLIGEDVELVVVKPREPVLVKADSGQIEQVLMNLAVNARDAMPAGGRLIVELSEVHLGEDLAAMPEPVPAGHWAVLTVGDNGTGMDAETLSHVFEPFFTTKETGKGTGLGLATVYGIVKQSGGLVTVASEPGRGTTFRIFLPRAERERPSKPDMLATGTGGAETILLVEDEPGVRGLICRLLEGRGYRVLAAESGADALALVDRHEGPIPLLVTDLVMPGLNGRELAAAVVSRRPGTRVLFISAYPSGVLSRRGLRESGARFLQKPFTEAALARAVRRALDAPAPASGDAKPGT